jgi:hypothetical protein
MRRIVTDVIRVFSNARRWSWVAPTVSNCDGKRTDQGTMM